MSEHEPVSATSSGRKQRQIGGLLAGLLAGLLIVSLIFLVVQTFTVINTIRESQKVNGIAARDSTSSLRLIEDCLAPEGTCAAARKTADERQTDNLTSLAVVVNACADRPGTQTLKEVERCVNRLLLRATSP